MMNVAQQRFMIHNEIDIISARMAVREYARHCGMSLKDQACISMAASSMANSLGLGQKAVAGSGEILIEYFESAPKRGVRVSCTKRYAANESLQSIHHMESSRWLVDDIKIKALSANCIEIVITKWDSLFKG